MIVNFNRVCNIALAISCALCILGGSLVATAPISEARTIIRLESCKDAAAVFAAGRAEEEASSTQELGVHCNSNYKTIQKVDEDHYQVQVSCENSHFARTYRVSVQRAGEFCGGTSAKTVTFSASK